jgi:prepilin-type N-terminal cleavage/methylation domain-containing protein
MVLTNKNIGFTLIELAVVLFIIGLLLGGILTPMATSIEQKRRVALEEQYDDIEEALLGFAIVNGRLPCPDCPLGAVAVACTAGTNVINDGIEDQSNAGVGNGCAVGVTTNVEGNLPWVTLGLTGTDPWGNILAYQVDEAYADADDGAPNPTTTPASCVPNTTGVSFSFCSQAIITIQDTGSTCGTAVTNVASNVPVVVYSQGSQTATSCNELENTDGDTTFVDRDYELTAATYYDDMIFWISPFLLDSRMVKAEVLP